VHPKSSLFFFLTPLILLSPAQMRDVAGESGATIWDALSNNCDTTGQIRFYQFLFLSMRSLYFLRMSNRLDKQGLNFWGDAFTGSPVVIYLLN